MIEILLLREENNMIKGVDLSEHNGVIEWHVMKENGIEFAIVS